MRRNIDGHDQHQAGHGHETDRRSLLAVATMGLAASVSPPARAHPNNGAQGAEKRSFVDLKEVAARDRIIAVQYAACTYHVATADGRHSEFTEADLRFVVDSSPLGPRRGKPVILPAGHMGDRALMFFASPDEIGTFVKY